MNIFFTNPDGLKFEAMNVDVDVQDMTARFTFVVESSLHLSSCYFVPALLQCHPLHTIAPELCRKLGQKMYED